MSLRDAVGLLNDGKLRLARRELRLGLRREPDAPWACQLLVQSYWQRGQPDRAARIIESTLPADSPLAELGRGHLARCLGRPDARDRLTRAERGDGPVAWAAAIEVAQLALNSADSDVRAARARRHFRATRNAWGIATATALQASLALAHFALDDALDLCAQAGRLREDLCDRAGLARIAQTEAKARFLLADYDAALDCLGRALAWQKSLGHTLESGIILNNIGLWHLDLASPDLARDALLEARRSFARIGDLFREAAALANLASARRRLGDLRGCERDYRKALTLLAAVGRPDAHGIAVAELAEALTRSGHPRRALAALAARPRGALSPTVRLLLGVEHGRALLASGKTSRARRVIAAARESLAGSHGGAIVARLQADTVQARTMLAAGMIPAASRLLGRTSAELEGLLERQRDPSIRMGLLDAHRDAHDALVAAMLARGERGLRDAFATVAALKARELRERRVEAPRAWSRLGSTREVIAAIPSDTALLEYHVAGDVSRVFVVGRGQLRVVTLAPNEARLTRDVTRLLAPLTAAGASADPRAELFAFEVPLARRLYRELIEPALAVLAERPRRLIVVPDGPLHALPFDLLISADARSADPPATPARDPGARFDRARYLLDDFELGYARSSLLVAAPRPRELGKLVALAYSPRDRADIADLPGTRAEVAAIAKVFPQRAVLRGRRATLSAYRTQAGTADVIHIAAHAYSDTLAPHRSRILLAAADGESELRPDAILTVALTARLVTLSACDSGGGRLRAREGIVGLARAFLEAGAEAVLASLWPVDDAVTAHLMTGFYRRLVAGESRIEAFAGARRDLRRGPGAAHHAHPFFWGAWVMIDHAPQ